jgi:iron complex transport system permease protein
MPAIVIFSNCPSWKEETSVDTPLLGQHARRSGAFFLSPSLLFGGVLLLLLALFLLSLAFGSVSIPIEQVLRVLLGQEVDQQSWVNIVTKVRLPKALTAMSAGAALGVVGLLMQTFFRNPLADPYILGTSAGASLGVALVVLGVGAGGGTLLAGASMAGDATLVIAAALGGGLTMMLVLIVARSIRNQTTLLVMGLMFSYLTSAFVSLLMHFAINERIQAYVNWSFGSFSGVVGSQLVIFLPVIVVGLVVANLLAKPLNALLLGDTYAHSMGVDVRRARYLVIGCSAVLTGVVTAFCGPIGFLGIAAPHIARNVFRTPDHRVLLPASLLTGAVAALMATFIADVPGSNLVLPLNAITAMIGAPIVIWVLIRGQK